MADTTIDSAVIVVIVMSVLQLMCPFIHYAIYRVWWGFKAGRVIPKEGKHDVGEPGVFFVPSVFSPIEVIKGSQPDKEEKDDGEGPSELPQKGGSFVRILSMDNYIAMWIWLIFLIFFAIFANQSLRDEDSGSLATVQVIVPLIMVSFSVLIVFVESFFAWELKYIKHISTEPLSDYLEELQKTKPNILMVVTVWHVETRWVRARPQGSKTSQIKRVVIDHVEKEKFHFEHWEDDSTDLNRVKFKSRLIRLNLASDVHLKDAFTIDCFNQQREDLMARVKASRQWGNEQQFYFRRDDRIKGMKQRLVAYADSSATTRWVSQPVFWLFTVFGLGWPFRFVFRFMTDKYKFRVVKNVSLVSPDSTPVSIRHVEPAGFEAQQEEPRINRKAFGSRQSLTASLENVAKFTPDIANRKFLSKKSISGEHLDKIHKRSKDKDDYEETQSCRSIDIFTTDKTHRRTSVSSESIASKKSRPASGMHNSQSASNLYFPRVDSQFWEDYSHTRGSMEIFITDKRSSTPKDGKLKKDKSDVEKFTEHLHMLRRSQEDLRDPKARLPPKGPPVVPKGKAVHVQNRTSPLPTKKQKDKTHVSLKSDAERRGSDNSISAQYVEPVTPDVKEVLRKHETPPKEDDVNVIQVLHGMDTSPTSSSRFGKQDKLKGEVARMPDSVTKVDIHAQPPQDAVKPFVDENTAPSPHSSLASAPLWKMGDGSTPSGKDSAFPSSTGSYSSQRATSDPLTPPLSPLVEQGPLKEIDDMVDEIAKSVDGISAPLPKRKHNRSLQELDTIMDQIATAVEEISTPLPKQRKRRFSKRSVNSSREDLSSGNGVEVIDVSLSGGGATLHKSASNSTKVSPLDLGYTPDSGMFSPEPDL